MAPQVTSWEELLWVSEEVDEDTGDFQYTMLAMVEDDMIYYGQLNKLKADILFQHATDSLVRIPDKEIFPQWPQGLTLTKAPEELPPDVFIKRPRLALYDIFSKHKVVHLLPKELVEEAEAMEVLGSQPHPNIIGYHGCHVRRGYITGLVLDRHPHDYACKLLLQDTFWKEFWAASGIEGEEHRGRIQGLAEAAGQIGAILRLAFRRNADGSPSEEVLVSESRMKQLRAWFGEQAARLT
ncbi:hypothetical protein H9Q70_009555 [Fusarium xylarioides]|nr:hypothetical protein H9Q70_009555 [Fusarium xylarioides]KAG5775061.1 hypothetical protein H9Q73_011264 [Fusarium xylarioides]